MWNHTSVLFDVCVCIMTYTTVLTFEFAPALIEKLEDGDGEVRQASAQALTRIGR